MRTLVLAYLMSQFGIPVTLCQVDSQKESDLQLTLPPAIYAVPGIETSIYFDNVILTEDSTKYQFKVVADVGESQERRWVVMPTDADVGQREVSVVVHSKDGKLIAQKSTVLHVVPQTAGAGKQIKLLIIGDSLTHASVYPNEVSRLLHQPGNPRLEMIGTHKPGGAADGVAHEGYGGWTWNRFLAHYEPNPDGKRKHSSPFVYPNKEGKPGFDLRRYFGQHCNGEPPHYIVIMLGINDCFHAKPDDAAAVEAKIDTMFESADKLLEAIRTAAPDTQIGLCLTTPPNLRQEAFTANYKDRYTRWGWKRIQHRLVQRQMDYVETKADSKISIVPTQVNLDPVDGYPNNNGVHPNAVGYKQIGATVYSWVKWRLALDELRWNYSAESFRPFWTTDIVQRESAMFIRDPETGRAKASVLFPVKRIIAVENSAGTVTYTPDADYVVEVGAREIVIPAKSRIVTKTADELRRPANSQKHRLTHRDGNGEILFGAKLEYHNMQTWITYSKADNNWPVKMPTFDAKALPRTIQMLRQAKPTSVVLLGDSISTGCNASGWGGGPPFQPAYQDLLREHLAAHYKTDVTLTNLSVGGTSTPWGVQQVSKVVDAKPDLVILAFGMNDSAGHSPKEYGQNISEMITTIRESLPDTEFILIAPMLGNRDWTVLKHDVFPKYRDELSNLCKPGVALADMTSVWTEFLNRKQDWDLTGNGVNHPNDFGHRVYAQVLSAILVEGE